MFDSSQTTTHTKTFSYCNICSLLPTPSPLQTVKFNTFQAFPATSIVFSMATIFAYHITWLFFMLCTSYSNMQIW